MINTGIFAAGCWEWNKRVAAEKKLPHLKVFFAAARLFHSQQPAAKMPVLNTSWQAFYKTCLVK